MTDDEGAIILACYNEAAYIERCLDSCLRQLGQVRVRVYVVDDGSTDNTPEILRGLASRHDQLTVYYRKHEERGRARAVGIDAALQNGCAWLLILDADMVLPADFIPETLDYLHNTVAGAVIVPELAFSDSRNYWTRVKVFERNTLFHAGEKVDLRTSIEGARLWRRGAFLQSGGFHPDQISFEDIQPTLRYARHGGQVARITTTHILHDEKHVQLMGLLRKKAYYFRHMPTTVKTEQDGLTNLLQRWYFFRPVLYRRENLRRYATAPHLALGMFAMYGLLTVQGLFNLVRGLFRQSPPATSIGELDAND